MKGGYLIYKCRNCGATIENTHAPNAQYAVQCIMEGWEMPKEWCGPRPGKTDMHFFCDEARGVSGVTDLVGYRED